MLTPLYPGNYLREISQAVSRCLLVVLIFIGFGVSRGSRPFPDTSSSLRKLSGLEEVLEESCGNEAEDELAPDLDDNPWTSTGANFSVLHRSIFPFLVRCATGPLMSPAKMFVK